MTQHELDELRNQFQQRSNEAKKRKRAKQKAVSAARRAIEARAELVAMGLSPSDAKYLHA